MTGVASAGLQLGPDEPGNPDDPGTNGRGTNGVQSVSASGDQGIDGLLAGVAWIGGTISYSFPNSASLYGSSEGTGPGQYPDPSPFNNFAELSAQQQGEVQRAFSLISSYTGLIFTEVTESSSVHATLRFANSSTPPTAYAYYPNTDQTGGDVFFGGTGGDPIIGNFDSGSAVLHEIGHAVALKHGQESSVYGQVPANLLDNEYSLMNYPAYIGAQESFSTLGPGSSPQTYMMYDIAALQYVYGANFNNVGISEVYTWSPVTGEEFINGAGQGTPFNNHIFSTVWTGGSTATYDLRSFAQNATLDLRPGGFLRFSDAQLADLGYGSADGPGVHMAQGDIYNALLYNGDTRSEVGTLYTGDGNDIVYGNDVVDTIVLGNGQDTLYAGSRGGTFTAGSGADELFGGAGTDYFNLDNLSATDIVDGGGGSNFAIFGAQASSYNMAFNNGTITVTVKSTPSDAAILTDIQTLQFTDTVVSAASLACLVAGARIATPNGPVAVEYLREGDLVITQSGECLPVIWLGHRRVACTAHPRPQSVLPVLVVAHAFGANTPARDLFLSPDHAVFVDEVLIPVKHLINGGTIRQVERQAVAYYHVELPRHQAILAEGLPVETYLDTGDRANFANGGVVALHPEFAQRVREAEGFARLVVTGPELASVRRRLACIAEAIGMPIPAPQAEPSAA